MSADRLPAAPPRVRVNVIRSTEPIDFTAWLERYAQAIVEARQKASTKEAA